MTRRSFESDRALRRVILAAVFLFPVAIDAQTVRLGVDVASFGAPAVPTNGVVYTILDLEKPANLDGTVTSVAFGWTRGDCPGAAKIKFFRPSRVPVPTGGFFYTFIAERGPFDVSTFNHPPALPPPFITTVALNPPVSVQRGDVIGITNLANCGGPTYAAQPPDAPPITSFAASGDVTSTIFGLSAGPFLPGISVFGSGPSAALGLLKDRFAVSLMAMDPRTRATAAGVPNRLGDASGYFSLPDFTGDAAFPEVMVKMVDATGSAALGGTFWFFFAPLTDVELVITLTDQSDGAVRTYTSAGASGGQLCGMADTSAFDNR